MCRLRMLLSLGWIYKEGGRIKKGKEGGCLYVKTPLFLFVHVYKHIRKLLLKLDLR